MSKVSRDSLKEAFATGQKPTGEDFADLIDTLGVSDEEKSAWDGKSEFDGSYNSLTNKPTIPTKTSQLSNDSNLETTTGSQGKADKALSDAKAYTDEEVSKLITRITELEGRLATE